MPSAASSALRFRSPQPPPSREAVVPKSRAEVEKLLERLDERSADELEAQDVDFKEWGKDDRAAVTKAVDWAVCMANGGGGTIVFGVADDLVGRRNAIVGVPRDVAVDRLRLAIYDRTDPKLTPTFDEIDVPEGTGRVLAMHVHPGMPPYTDTSGKGLIRVGKDCKPLTGAMRRQFFLDAGAEDYTGETVGPVDRGLFSAAAIGALRDAATKESAPDELTKLGDEELLAAIGVVHEGRLTRAAVLLAGSEDALRRHVPKYAWTHLRMSSDTDYSARLDGRAAIPLALARILDRMSADNPIETIRHGLHHFEYSTFPEIALREALLNAFCHADYRIASPILIKQFIGRLAITNPGRLVGGITPDNILHHAPVARNPCLVEALVRLRLINRANLGIQRIYKSLLIEGKDLPAIEEVGKSLRITFRASNLAPAFRTFVEEEQKAGTDLGVDDLLILDHLLRSAEIDVVEASRICQRSRDDASAVLARMEQNLGYVDHGGDSEYSYWTLRPDVHARLSNAEGSKQNRGAEWEGVKARVLNVIQRRAARGAQPLVNADVRRITGLDRHQVYRLVQEFANEGKIRIDGHGRAAKYVYCDDSAKGVRT